MASHKIAPAAILSLREALTRIYWYKSDLRSFLTSCLKDPSLLGRLNWDSYKREIVTQLVSYMGQRQTQYQGELIQLMEAVCDVQDFSHLQLLEDGDVKVARAEQAVASLQTHVRPHQAMITEEREAEARRRAAYEQSLQRREVQDRLEKIKGDFFQIVGPSTPQRRGILLEHLLYDLFEVFDLDPKAAFRLQGEQIDGSFTFDNTDYVLEAKWQASPAEPADLDTFSGKIERKLENTLGLFLSVNGFTRNAIDLHSQNRPVMILMDGSDLMAVLEGRIDLLALLLRKRRHAAQTGKVFLAVHEILAL